MDLLRCLVLGPEVELVKEDLAGPGERVVVGAAEEELVEPVGDGPGVDDRGVVVSTHHLTVNV